MNKLQRIIILLWAVVLGTTQTRRHHVYRHGRAQADALLGPLRTDPAFQKLCEQKQP